MERVARTELFHVFIMETIILFCVKMLFCFKRLLLLCSGNEYAFAL